MYRGRPVVQDETDGGESGQDSDHTVTYRGQPVEK